MVSLRVDWSKWRQSYRGLQENPLLEYVFTGGTESDDKGGISSDWADRIATTSGAERTEIITDALKEIVGQVLRVKPASLRPDQPLTDLGLDSLMAVEMETLIESNIGVALPPASLMQARTIGQLAKLLLLKSRPPLNPTPSTLTHFRTPTSIACSTTTKKSQ